MKILEKKDNRNIKENMRCICNNVYRTVDSGQWTVDIDVNDIYDY